MDLIPTSATSPSERGATEALLEIIAQPRPEDRRGVYVRCPGTRQTFDIGECLFCAHYRGLWFGAPGRCALRCAFNDERVP